MSEAGEVVEPLAAAAESPPFRFYDNRQKYLTFVNTCNEKAVVVKRAAFELAQLRPTPPSLRIFDAGMGDATVLSRMMRTTHQLFPTVPLLAVAKEISLEDVRLGLEKMPDRFYEHGNTVLVITNLSYAERAVAGARRPGEGADQLAGREARGDLGERVRRPDRSARAGARARLGDQAEPADRQPDLRPPLGARRLPRRPRVRARLGDPARGRASRRRLRLRARLAALARAHEREASRRRRSSRRSRAR